MLLGLRKARQRMLHSPLFLIDKILVRRYWGVEVAVVPTGSVYGVRRSISKI